MTGISNHPPKAATSTGMNEQEACAVDEMMVDPVTMGNPVIMDDHDSHRDDGLTSQQSQDQSKVSTGSSVSTSIVDAVDIESPSNEPTPSLSNHVSDTLSIPTGGSNDVYLYVQHFSHLPTTETLLQCLLNTAAVVVAANGATRALIVFAVLSRVLWAVVHGQPADAVAILSPHNATN